MMSLRGVSGDLAGLFAIHDAHNFSKSIQSKQEEHSSQMLRRGFDQCNTKNDRLIEHEVHISAADTLIGARR